MLNFSESSFSISVMGLTQTVPSKWVIPTKSLQFGETTRAHRDSLAAIWQISVDRSLFNPGGVGVLSLLAHREISENRRQMKSGQPQYLFGAERLPMGLRETIKSLLSALYFSVCVNLFPRELHALLNTTGVRSEFRRSLPLARPPRVQSQVTVACVRLGLSGMLRRL
jgi:hypothetical protein